MIHDPLPPASVSPTRKLAELLLGGDEELEHFVRSRRRDGKAWRLVARDLYEATDHQVDVTYETLRAWFPDRAAVRAS